MPVEVRFATGRQRWMKSANRAEDRSGLIHIGCDETDLAVYDAAQVILVTVMDERGAITKTIKGRAHADPDH